MLFGDLTERGGERLEARENALRSVGWKNAEMEPALPSFICSVIRFVLSLFPLVVFIPLIMAPQ